MNIIETASSELRQVITEIQTVIVGQNHMVERLMVALLSRGHILLEGLPGVAKTLAVSTMADSIGGTFTRLQFTPDLLPSDLIGTRIWRTTDERFDIEWGPVFANFVLTDEINRAPAKVQSALLEVMAERQVSIGGKTKPLPSPFLVLATQNPVESEGVYALPEAQRDRFLMKVKVEYPTPVEELEIIERVSVEMPAASQVMTLERLQSLQQLADNVYVDSTAARYAVDLVMATREPAERGMPELSPMIEFGVSPRATLGLVAAARALATIRGQSFISPQDIFDVARDVLRHRLMLSYESLAEGITADDVINRILTMVPAAQVDTTTLRAAGDDRLTQLFVTTNDGASVNPVAHQSANKKLSTEETERAEGDKQTSTSADSAHNYPPNPPEPANNTGVQAPTNPTGSSAGQSVT